jgi:hypothetical protein
VGLLDQFAKSGYPLVTLKYYADNKPLVISGGRNDQPMRALLMPVRK